MIAISGAHTLGFSHCNLFANRLYSFSSSSRVDPSLDPTYGQQLLASCPQNVAPEFFFQRPCSFFLTNDFPDGFCLVNKIFF
ncbi:putative peroxidase [Helianthus debilis subsp. tardiflorus]